MNRRINPWVVVLTAALTFGSLMAFVGPRSFGNNHWGRFGYHDRQGWSGHHNRYNYRNRDHWRNERRNEQIPDSSDF